MKKIAKSLFIILFFIVGMWPVGYAQTLVTITGTIVDEHLRPVDATVTVKETGRGIATNAKGYFTLNNVASNATLIITGTSINLLEVKVSGRKDLGVINVVQKVATIEAVVVEANTGYQTLQPNEINGSLVVINKRILNQQTGTNILNRLDGVTPGLLFNIGKSNSGNSQNKTNITIRGLGTINGPLDPLIVLDGFIYEGDINNINPNDVENVTVLKDAEAASVWGARASNGVIVITTRKASLNQRMSLLASASILVTTKPDLRSLPQLSSSDYIDVEAMLFSKGYFDDRINTTPWLSLTPAVNIFKRRLAGEISASDSAQAIDALKNTDARNEYNKYVYRNALTQQYNLVLRGGSSLNGYNFSISGDRNLSELHATFDKVNVLLGNTFHPLKNLRLDINAHYTSSISKSGMQPYGSIKPGDRYVPYYTLRGTNGTALPVETLYNSSYVDTVGGGQLFDWKYYPLDDYKHDQTTNRQQELFAIAGVNYAFSRAFNVDLKYQYQRQITTAERLADLQSFYARDLVNTFSQVDYATRTVNYIVPAGGIRNLGTTTVGSHTLRAQLNFNKTAGVHSFTGIAGAEQREAKTNRDEYTMYGFVGDPLNVSQMDQVNEYPSILTGNTSSVGDGPKTSGTIYRFVSLYANSAYTLKSRYSFTASMRRDGSNIFGANANDKWKPLWSAGAGWKISDEKFYGVRWLPSLRLKVSYGHNGNVDLTKTALPIAAVVGADPYSGYTYSRIQQINNPDLRWEQSKQLNAGIEFSTPHNRVYGSVDVYHKNGSDLYGEALLDYTSIGFMSTVIKNVAGTKGRGIDVVLNSNNVVGKLGWSSSLLFSYNKTITSKYYSVRSSDINELVGGGNSIIPVVGKELYGIVAYKWGGLDSLGNPQGYLNGALSTDYTAIAAQTGGLDDGHLVYLGPGTPRYFGLFTNTINWKHFSLSAAVSYKLGYHFWKTSISYYGLVNGGYSSRDFSQRWQKSGDEAFTDVPAFNYPLNSLSDNFYRTSSVNVLKGAHARLQYINLSYMPEIKTRPKQVFRSVEVYSNIANLGILWRANKQGIDPDYPSIAPSPSFAFGLRCVF